MKFQGLYTAIVTPFAGNRVDEEAFRMLVEAQIAAGVAGIVAVGTTGESPTLTVKEHLRVIELAVVRLLRERGLIPPQKLSI